MAQAYRYPLTRVCLRSGTRTLPLAMLHLFPEEGAITAVDNETGAEYELELTGPRVLAGLSGLYAAHDPEVNDELHVTPLGDGRFGFDVVSRVRRSQATTTTALAGVLDELAAAGVPVTAAEVHALFPTLPDGFDLEPYLASDPRFVQRNGRWQSAAAETEESELEPESPKPARLSTEAPVAAAELVEVAVGGTAVAQATAAGGGAGSAARAGEQVRGEAGGEGAGGTTRASEPLAAEQPPLWQEGGSAAIWQGFAASAERPAPRGGEAPGSRQVHERRVPEPARAVEEPLDDADLTALELAQRLRRVLEPLGYRATPLGGGQMTLTADLGRRQYEVHAQLLPSGERLDWAALLAKRRTSSARFLAVFGDHRDLLRLTSPAELARATLWSWEALDRLRVLHGTVPVSPIDLESHFDRDGLFESGLDRFEQGVAARVAERGATSQVLTRLGQMRAPSVFLLEELATDAGMSRDAVLRILERLSEAPFHLVARVDQGEFLLRVRVADALTGLAAYAVSLKERLPSRKHERLTGLDDEPAESGGAEAAADAVDGEGGPASARLGEEHGPLGDSLRA